MKSFKKPAMERLIEWMMFTNECEVHPLIIEKAEQLYAEEQRQVTLKETKAVIDLRNLESDYS